MEKKSSYNRFELHVTVVGIALWYRTISTLQPCDTNQICHTNSLIPG